MRQEEPIASHTEPQTPDRRSAVPDTRVPPPTPIENNRTIQIDCFIPHAQVDARYLDTPYYVVPRDEVGQEAFAVIRDAMRGKNVVGMGGVVLARRERPIIVEPMGNGDPWDHLAVQSRGQGRSRLLRQHSDTRTAR
jgi:Ku70/Ku80 beta-barrel domain